MSQHQAESAQALLDALTSQLQSISMQPDSQLNAVSIKLPEFWTTSPEVWFARVEAQFGTKNITQDQTRYDYVVSALDFKTAEEVQDVLVSPPEAEKYTTLKKALIKAFGKFQAQRDSELLNLNGLGDRKPTALLRKINALNDDPQTLKRALFLSNLPADVQSILAGQDFSDIEKLADAADRVWEARCTSVHHITQDSGQPSATIESVKRHRAHMTRPVDTNTTSSSHVPSPPVCFYHLRFGPQARNCQPGCKFSSLLSKSFGKRQSQPLGVAAAGTSNQSSTLSVVDKKSGHSYLVDTGAEVSVYPASLQVRQTQHPSTTLSAANGTSIRTWGKRSISLALGPKRHYTHEFYIADVTRPILGADFFTTHGLTIDLRGRRLLSLDNISILLQDTKPPLTLAGLGLPHQNWYSGLLQQFPELLTPCFQSSINKHGVEHHIVTHGPPTYARARRLDQEKLSAAKAEFLQMEEMGIVRRSKSPWSSPLHVVPKPGGKWRPCGDYRRLNASTKDDRYPLPHIQAFNSHLAGCTVFSKIDLIRGYHQIPMAQTSIAKTAVITPFGLWEFLRMPFGLKNAAQSFQRPMDGILRDVPFAFVYLDDILVASHSPHVSTAFHTFVFKWTGH